MSWESSKLTPAQRFEKYFEAAKEVYCQSYDCEKVTQKAIVEWYNKRFHASLSEASLSKYLKGINEIPVDVYANMKELAGIEEVWMGASASRGEYETLSSIRESLEFIMDEFEAVCDNPRLEVTNRLSIRRLVKYFMEYCQSASGNDMYTSVNKLKLLKNEIQNVELLLTEKKFDAVYGVRQVQKSFAEDHSTALHSLKAGANNNSTYDYDLLLPKLNHLSQVVERCIELQDQIAKKQN